jgi:ComF family protein
MMWLDLLYPPCCMVCGLRCPHHGVCGACTQELPWNLQACPQCAERLAGDGTCLRCLYRSPAWAAALVPLRYAPPVDRLIGDFKFRRRLDRGAWLARMLAEAVDATAGDRRPDAVVAVPLHRSRLRRRGFNQAAVLAAHLARTLDLAEFSGLVQRRRSTATQSELPAEQRADNLRGAFALTAAPQPLHDLHVAIVDDVLTTGATAGELAEVLYRGGASRVDLWCCARAQPGARTRPDPEPRRPRGDAQPRNR